jgi:hypothetical protein
MQTWKRYDPSDRIPKTVCSVPSRSARNTGQLVDDVGKKPLALAGWMSRKSHGPAAGPTAEMAMMRRVVATKAAMNELSLVS